VPTEGGGTLRLVIYDPSSCPKNSEELNRFYRVFPDRERRPLHSCRLPASMQHNSAPVVLVTKDINMQLKARAGGIECQDYLNDKVDVREVSMTRHAESRSPRMELQRFASSGLIEVDEETRGNASINEYVLLSSGEKQTISCRRRTAAS